MGSGRLALLSVVIAISAGAAYVLLLRVPIVRNHPEAYVVAFALATALLHDHRLRAAPQPASLLRHGVVRDSPERRPVVVSKSVVTPSQRCPSWPPLAW